METLGKLFGSVNKVKLLRLFLQNPELALSTREAARRAKVSPATASREIKGLAAIDLLQKKKIKGVAGWQLNSTFPMLSSLRQLVKSKVVDHKRDLVQQFGRCGRVNLLLIAGALIDSPDARADILLVGDRLKRSAVDRVVRDLEAETGAELSYAVLETADFNYRLNASDKFVRDVLDYPHERLIDRLASI